MQRRKLFTLLMVILAMALLGSCRQAAPAFKCTDKIGCVTIAPGEPIKIGTLLVSSGGSANLGEFSLQAIELALSQRDNKLLGHALVLQKEDEQCTPQGGANSALKIVADPKVVGIIGTVCSSSATDASKIMSEAGLVMISGANTVPALTGAGNEKGKNWQAGYFRTVQNATYWGDTAATFAFQKLGKTKAATIHDGDAYAQALAALFAQKFTQLGGKIVLAASINRGDKDMLPVLTAVAKAEAEFLFYPVFQPESDYLTIQSKSVAGLEKIERMMAGASATEKFIKAVDSHGLGMYVLSTKPSGAAYDKFSADFKAKYDKGIPHSLVPYTYDAINLLLAKLEAVAVKEADGTLHIGRQALRDALYATNNLPGGSGTITCNPFGDCNIGSTSVLQLKDPTAGLDGLNSNVVFSYTPGESK